MWPLGAYNSTLQSQQRSCGVSDYGVVCGHQGRTTARCRASGGRVACLTTVLCVATRGVQQHAAEPAAVGGGSGAGGRHTADGA